MCERLTYKGDALHHKKSIRNVLRVEVSPEPVLLLGVGVYTGNEDELLDDVSGKHITFDRVTTTINIWTTSQSNDTKTAAELISSKSITMNTEQAKTLAKLKIPNKIQNTMTMWLDEPMVLLPSIAYEVEHNILATDVVNQYSGWPITTLGADLWTCHGSTTSPITVSNKITFTFSEPLFKTGRCCLWEGQIPYFRFWRLSTNKDIQANVETRMNSDCEIN